MAVTVETLDKLERKITLTLPVDVIAKEVDSRLKRLSRQVKVDGFRPGKVPMNIIGQRYGYQVQYEVMNDKVGEVFQAAATEANLRVAGQPRISEKEGAPEGEMAFDAIFEVFPEVKMPDLSTLEIDKISSEVTEDTESQIKIKFSVMDSGIGLSKETIQRIFAEFSQADSTMSRRYGGSGLGLTISKRLIELMGGHAIALGCFGRAYGCAMAPDGDEGGRVENSQTDEDQARDQKIRKDAMHHIDGHVHEAPIRDELLRHLKSLRVHAHGLPLVLRLSQGIEHLVAVLRIMAVSRQAACDDAQLLRRGTVQD